MTELVKVEIDIVTGEARDWQWMGLLSKDSLKMLTMLADLQSDADTEKRNQETLA